MSGVLDQDLLSILACPKCKSTLTLTRDEAGLACASCQVVYPIRQGVPVMLAEEVAHHRVGGEIDTTSASIGAEGEKAVFVIVEGKNKEEKIELLKGTCRAIGRSLDEMEKTKVFSIDASIHLDENSKKLVMQYLAKQFQKTGAASNKIQGKEVLGDFVRGADFQVRDSAVSRLHAMLFYGESGSIGILDLVSRNGTYVNGAEVESKMLKKGDLITIGGTKIRFE